MTRKLVYWNKTGYEMGYYCISSSLMLSRDLRRGNYLKIWREHKQTGPVSVSVTANTHKKFSGRARLADVLCVSVFPKAFSCFTKRKDTVIHHSTYWENKLSINISRKYRIFRFFFVRKLKFKIFVEICLHKKSYLFIETIIIRVFCPKAGPSLQSQEEPRLYF